MKSRLVLALALVAGIAVSAFSQGAVYTIKAPDGWKKHEGSSAPEHYMKDGVSLMLTIDTAPASTKTPDAYVEFVKKQYSSSFKNVKFQSVKKLTINGLDARELVYTAEISNMKMKYDVVYVWKQPKVYTMTAGGLAEGFDAMSADYQAFFHSFKLK